MSFNITDRHYEFCFEGAVVLHIQDYGGFFTIGRSGNMDAFFFAIFDEVYLDVDAHRFGWMVIRGKHGIFRCY